MTIGSLFSGIGGLEMGLEACAMGPVVWQCDVDPYARAVLRHHWPTVRHYEDVKEIDERAKRPDIICGGFPCQDISNAGKQAGIGGDRSGLWSEFARIIGLLRPRLVFVENVAALLGRGLSRVLGDLAALGYDAEWETFRASHVGAPHRRERVFILAYTDGERWKVDRQERDGSLPKLDGWQRDAKHLQAVTIAGSRHIYPPRPDQLSERYDPKPVIRRGDDGATGSTHRMRLIGNAVVPDQAALAFRILSERRTRGRAAVTKGSR